ncbi:MAG: FtsW/RodA/SpoVE family cell cycle protein, partial [Candidatus Roizmanbacteria bacterium]
MRKEKKIPPVKLGKSPQAPTDKHKARKRDLTLLFFLPILLTLIGLFFIFEASSVSAFREYGDSFYFFKQQALWMGVGVVAMITFSYIDYRIWYKLATPLIGISLLFLLLVLFPGVGLKVGGA